MLQLTTERFTLLHEGRFWSQHQTNYAILPNLTQHLHLIWPNEPRITGLSKATRVDNAQLSLSLSITPELKNVGFYESVICTRILHQ